MSTSPDDLRNKTFNIVKKGYERGEVHRFLGNLADELVEFDRIVATDEEIVEADVIEVDEIKPEQEVEPEVVVDADDGDIDDQAEGSVAAESSPDAEPPEGRDASPRSTTSVSTDDFDRVGNEISLMLRQAQESSLKIRNDAEVEARTLVDQVRLDIESDRLAHEQAAAELITRTEERATTMRTEAEGYASQVRESADSYSDERRDEVEQAHADSFAAAKQDRALAADALQAAKGEADATLSEAKRRAEDIVSMAEKDAQEKPDLMLAEARATLANLVDAEENSRTNLEDARGAIEDALAQWKLSDAVPDVT
jgi:DivIVA domain-containing protein